VYSSWKDGMEVAAHEMPVNTLKAAVPEGTDLLARASNIVGEDSLMPRITPYHMGRIAFCHSQAFHAWLPSCSPSGTKLD
jgi:hypothetical protein